jgi:hypothetical protein
MKCQVEDGRLSTCMTSESITKSGMKLVDHLSSVKLGGTRKKKRYRYNNGTKATFYRKKYKTNRNKSNVSKLFRTYRRLKEKCNL